MLLVDSSKLGDRSMVFVGPISLADHVLTERAHDAATQANLERLRSDARDAEIVDWP